jgi:hypothetical protein
LQAAKQGFGPNHANSAQSLKNLASFYRKQGATKKRRRSSAEQG